jgi:DNA-binding LytR/AlgR family response regulator
MSEQTTPPRTGLRALVVDDEAPALSELTYLLRQDDRIGDIRTASNGADALRALDSAPVDVVFCDIKMPGLDGMALARVLARFADRPQVVFVTAYDHHAVDAFEVRATDYVMKPVGAARLSEAVRRVVTALAAATGSGSSDPVLTDETIPVGLGGVTTFIKRSQVRYAQAQGDYARLHTATGSHLVRTSLTTLEERWAEAGFVRIHRSTLVSLPHVDAVVSGPGGCKIRLGSVELQVSRRHLRDLRKRLSLTGGAAAAQTQASAPSPPSPSTTVPPAPSTAVPPAPTKL